MTREEEADVLVVGGGPAGIAAAVGAARLGKRVTLLERNPFLGGRATASLVLVMDDWTDGEKLVVAGFAREFVDRALEQGFAYATPQEVLQSRTSLTEEEREYWASWGFSYLFGEGGSKPVTYAVFCDPEGFKAVAEDMVAAAKIDLVLMSDVVATRVAEGLITEVLARQREGHVAYHVRFVVDASGDGEVIANARAPHVEASYLVTLVHRIGGVDVEGWERFRRTHPDRASQLEAEVRRIYGGCWQRWWLRTTIPYTIWANAPHLTGYSGLSSRQLTGAIAEARRRILSAIRFLRAEVPGFQGCFLLDTCMEPGIRQTRLLHGAYVLTIEDIRAGARFTDSVGVVRTCEIPYRCLVPLKVENLLVAGRCFSATPEAQRVVREIPTCMVTGQAAGVAAALCVGSNTSNWKLDVNALRKELRRQGAIVSWSQETV